jgi:hypothetical protein
VVVRKWCMVGPALLPSLGPLRARCTGGIMLLFRPSLTVAAHSGLFINAMATKERRRLWPISAPPPWPMSAPTRTATGASGRPSLPSLEWRASTSRKAPDPGVSGADPIETRPGFSALDRIEATASHGAGGGRLPLRADLVPRIDFPLIERGVRGLTASGDDHQHGRSVQGRDAPNRRHVRPAREGRLVAKLRGARA